MGRNWSKLKRHEFRHERAKQTLILVFVAIMFSGVLVTIFSLPAAATDYSYPSSENVYEGGTTSFDNAKDNDGNYENIFENSYQTVTYDNTYALAVYYDNTSTPKYRIWNGSTWSAQSSCTALSGTLEWVVLKYARTRDEAILGTLDATGDIRVQFWNGSTSIWSATKLIANVGTTNDAYRSFDIEYENGNDNAVIVFTENSAATTLRYSIWNGSTWTTDNAAINLNYPTTGVIYWVEMTANPTADNNEMALIYSDASSNVFGFRRSGGVWDNMGATAVWDTSGSTAPTKKWVDVAYESQSGSIMFMWADATATDQYWRIYENTPRVLSAATLLDISTAGSIGNWIKLVSDPRTDNILYGCQTVTAMELEVCEWSGTAWGTSSELEASMEDTLDRNFGMTYETWPTDNVGHAWIMYGDDATVSMRHKTGSAWSTASVVAGSDDTARVFMIAHPISGVVFSIMAQDSTSANDDLLENDNTGGSAWGGTSFWAGPMGANPIFEGFSIAPKVINIHANYRENVQHNITGIPTATNYQLQIKYYTAGDSEAVSVYLKNFTSGGWDNQGNIQGGNPASPNYFTANVDTDHISGGQVDIRYVQPDNDGTQTSLMVDYTRVRVNSPPTAPTLLALTAPIKVGETLTATASGSTDNNGDSITYYYRFINQTDNVERQAYSTSNTYTITTADARDNIRVLVKAWDGYEYSGELENSIIVSAPAYAYVTGENVYEGGTVDFDNAKADDNTYENIFENNYQVITYDNTYALAVYYDATSTPKYRIWDGTAWGAQGNCTALSGTLEWVVLKYARTRDEAILGTLDTTGDIRVQFWNGSVWSATKLIANVGTTNDAYRSFDIGYENGADNAVIVFTENSAATKLRYSVWNGSTWTTDNAAINLNYPTTGVIYWVETAANPRPDNNEIALIYGDANSDVFGYRWSGTVWDNMSATAVWDTSGSTNPAAKWVDVAYESQSGSIMFMWADATATDQYWRIYENTPRVLSAATLLDISTAGSIGNWILLAADPRTDNILYGMQTVTAFELEVCEWSGTAWGASSELSAGMEDTLDRNFGMTYETFPTDNVGHAWIMYGDSATVTRRHKIGLTWDAGTVVTGSDDTARVFMIAHPVSGVVFSIMAQDSTSANDDLLENDNTGSTWGGTSFWAGPMGANPVFEGFGIAPKIITITPCYRENVQHNITGIPTATNYQLQIKYYTSGDSEAVSVYLYNFTSGNWDSQGNIQGGTFANPNYFTANVDTDHISDGNVYVRYVQPDNDGTQTSLMVDYTRIRVNVPPTAPTLLALTAPIKVGQTLTATASGSTDNDGDSLTYYYRFYNQTDSVERQAYSTTSTYTIVVADAHDNIRVLAKAWDGYEYSGENENSIIIANTAPTTPSTPDLTPATVYVGTTLIASSSGSTDADSDPITYYYKFYNVDDATIQRDWGTDNSYVIQASDAHDTIRVYVKVNDGYENSTENSADKAVATVAYAYVTGENVYEGGTVDFDNAKADDNIYENIFENNYQSITYDNTYALAVYYDATSTPKYRIWDGTAWGAQGNCTALSGTLEWVVLKYARTRDEAILGTLDATGDIRVQFWNGSVWSATKLIANVGTTNDAYRSFDIEYENGNDNAVIVFTENSAATKLRYSVWNGSTWTTDNAAINLNYPTTGVIYWVEMAANPTADNNEMALIYGDANSDVFGFRRSGGVWDNMGATAVWDASGSGVPTKKWVDVAYESQSGSIMFMWIDLTATDQYWRIYENTPRVLSAATLLDISTAGSVGAWMKLVSDPRTDNILYGMQTNTAMELEVCEWSGTAWGASSEPDSAMENTLAPNFGMTYETFPQDNIGHAWIMYGDAATVSRIHKTGSTWTTPVVVTGSDDTSRVFMIAHPVSGVVFSIMAQSETSDSDDLLENDNTGSTWGGTLFWDGGIGTNTLYEGFGIAPKVVTVTPCYRENVQHNITGIPIGNNYQLQIKYYTTGDSEAVSVYLKNFTSGNWDNQGNIQGGTFASPNYFTANVDADHISGNQVDIRYVQPDNDPTQTSLMVDYTRVIHNLPPNKPTSLSPSTRQTTSVTISCVVVDNCGDRINVFFYEDNATHSLIDNVWVDSGGTATRTWSGLTRGHTYVFFARGQDNGGAWGENSDTCSFLVNSLPIAENQKAENRVNPDNLTTSTPLLSWDYFDNDGDGQTQRQIQVGTVENDNSMWDSTVSTSATSATYVGSALSGGVIYCWRVRVFDNYEWSSWLYGGTFKLAAWKLIESWTGAVNATTGQWKQVESWMGTVSAPVAWQLVETWTGTANATAQWRLVESWTGTVNTTAAQWQLIESWTGTYYVGAEPATLIDNRGQIGAITGGSVADTRTQDGIYENIAEQNLAPSDTYTYVSSCDNVKGTVTDFANQLAEDGAYATLGWGWEDRAAWPGTIGVTTACYAENAGVKYVYAFEGKASPDYVYRYDIAANTWTNMFNMAVTAASGISVVWNRADNIYWLSGGSSPTFYAYYISSNTKSAALATPPQRANSGATLAYDGGDNIYALLVSSATGATQSWIYSYSISSNTWTFIDNTPEVIGTGGGLIRVGNYLYVASSIFATQTGHFLRYDLVNSKWDWLASLPNSPTTFWGSGDGLENVGTNYIYANVGSSTQTGFFRFSISDNAWTSLENSPAAQSNAGDRLASDGTYLYLVRAYTDSSFWRYLVTVTGYNMEINENISSIPSADNYTLQMKYKLANTNDNFKVQVWNGSAWNDRGAVLSSTDWTDWSYVLLSSEVIGGKVQVKFVDVNSSSTPQDNLLIDYLRVEGTAALQYALRWEHQIENVATGLDSYTVRIRGCTSDDSENVVVAIWDNTNSKWENIDNLTTTERTITKVIMGSQISNYLRGENIYIKYESWDNTDSTQTTIHIDLACATWSVTVNATTGQWRLIETWTGTVNATTGQWRLIESWTNSWTQTMWTGGRTTPTLQSGTWGSSYDNYYAGENESNANNELKLAQASTTTWWDSAWTRRAPITIIGSHPENYQLEVIIPHDSDMRSDYGDLRFLENENAGVLSYWIENYTADNATVWVRRLENDDNTIYMYYGNSSAVSESNKDATLIRLIDYDPIAVWHLDENSGTNAPDSSGNGHNGTLTNFGFTENSGWVSDENFGIALRFDGDNDYVSVPNSDVFNFEANGENMTLSAWVKPISEPYIAGTIFSRFDTSGSGNGWCLFMQNDRIYFYTNFGSIYIGSSSTLTLGNWYYVTLTYYSPGTAEIYINGVQKASGNGDISDYNDDLNIGRRIDQTEFYWNGLIADAVIFSRALSTSEISGLYDNENYLTHKYTSPEPTVSVGSEEQVLIQHVGGAFVESSIYDAGSTVDWGNVSWSDNIPSGTNVVVKVRTGSDNNPYPNDTENWSGWCQYDNNTENASLPNGRYAQYRIELSTTDNAQTPVFYDITITHTTVNATTGQWHEVESWTGAVNWWDASWTRRRPITISNAGSDLVDYQVPVTVDTASLISAGKMQANGADIRFLDNRWEYAMPMTITNSDSALTDYQVLITVDTATLIAAGKMQANGADIRFKDSDNRADLYYWIENGINTTSTKIWVKIPSVPTGSKTVYMYYGNPSATSASNENTTFIRVIDNVVGSWSLDEGTGTTTADNSGNNNTGTISGAAWTTSGKFGNALDFDGVDDYVDLGTANLLPDGVGTVSVWVKLNADAICKNNYLITKGNDAAGQSWGIDIIPADSSNANLVLLYGNAQWVQTGDIPYSLSDWHMVTVVMKSDDSQEIYLDGVRKDTTPPLPTMTPDAGLSFRIGGQDRAEPGYEYTTNGTIDEVAVYNRALSASEILDIYDNYGYVTPNYPSRTLVRNYASPEPTTSVGAEAAVNGFELSHWIEPGTINTASTKIWVRVPSIPASSSTIYMYYDNPSATRVDNENTTFIRVIDNVVGSWSLDEGTGTTTADNSGNNNTGTISGAAWTTSGKFGNALDFDGVDNYVEIADNPSLEFGSSNYAIEAWFKTSGMPSAVAHPIVAKMDGWGGDSDWQLIMDDDGNVFYQAREWEDLTISTSDYDYRDGNWHHVVVTKTDGGDSGTKLYVDGVLKASGSGVNIEDSDVPVRIGASCEGFYFGGTIDEVRIYTRGLSASEISDIYNNYGYVTPNYPGRTLVRNYASPEPTTSVGGEETQTLVVAPASWQLIESWTGTVNTTAAQWQLIESWTGTVTAVLPSKPLLYRPENNLNTNDNTPTFEWTVGSNTDNHRLLVDNDSDLLSPIDNVLLGATNNTWTKSGAGYLEGVYYWKVVAININGENESAVWVFRVDITAPAAPTPISPENNTPIDNDDQPLFQWSTVTDPSTPVTYALVIDNDNDFSSPICIKADITENSHEIENKLTENFSPYYWRVTARDNAGNENISGWYKFTLKVPPTSSVSAISPYWQTTSPTAITAAASDNDGLVENVELWYRYSGDNSSWGAWTWFENDNTSPYEWSFDFPSSNGLYEFYTRALDDRGNYENVPAVADTSCGFDNVTPSKPTLVSPENNATIDTDDQPTFQWSTVTDLSGISYTLVIDNDNDFSSPIYNRAGITENSHEIENKLTENFSPYYWRVTARDNAGNENVANWYKFMLKVPPTSSVSAISPYWDNSSTRTITASASDNDGIIENVEFWYRYRENSEASWGAWTWFENDNTSPYEWSFDFPSSNGLYEFYTRALDDRGNYENVPAVADTSCGFDNVTPSKPTLVSPENNVTTADDTPTFAWTAVSDLSGVTYELVVDNEVSFTAPYVYHKTGLLDNQHTSENSLSDNEYYWQVRAVDNTGNVGGWAEWYKFTVHVVIGKPTPTAPTDGENTNDNTPTFIWTAGAHAENHRLLVDNDSDFGTPVENLILAMPTTSYTIAAENSLSDGTYYWMVVAINRSGENESDVWSFVVDTVKPTAPTLVSPVNGDTISTSTPTFDWSDVSDPSTPVTYTLEIIGWLTKTGLTSSTYTLAGGEALPDGAYSWRVQARDNAGNESYWSENWSFTVSTAPPADFSISVSPSSGEVMLGDSVTATVTVTPSGGYRSVVGLSARGQPSGVVVSFSPSSGTPSFTSTFTISVGRNALTGAYVITIIGAGADGTVHSTTYTLKIKIPLSSVNSIAPYWQKATPFSITAMTSDNGGQVTNIALYYRYSSDNLSWGNWTSFGVDNEEPWSWSFTAPRGDGYYEFYSIARDNKGYEEPAKLRADARCGVDTTAPMAPVLISPVDGMRTRDTTPAFDWGDVTDLSGVTYEFTITAYDTNVMTKTVPSSSYAIESSEALPESIYHWRIRAIDGAGNVSDWSETRSFTIELVPPTTVNLGTVHAGTPQVADFTQYNVFIIKVTIITLRDVDNVEISIRESIGKPAWVSEPSGMMYSIYATVTTNIAPSDISSAVILFQLPKSWILQNEIDAGTTTLLRTGSDWHTLSTTPVGGDENYSYFDATTTEFSLFVATGEKAIPPVVPPSRLPLLLIILSIIAVVVGGAIAYYLLTPSRQFAVLRRIERAVVRPRKRQIGELEVEPPVRVRRRVGPTDQVALRRLEHIMRERRKRWERETRKKSVNRKVKLGKVKQKKLAKGRKPVRVRRQVSRTDQVALRRLEHIMRERKKKWEGERQKKSVKRKTKPRKMRKKPVNRRVKLKKVKQKKLVKGRKRSKTKS